MIPLFMNIQFAYRFTGEDEGCLSHSCIRLNLLSKSSDIKYISLFSILTGQKRKKHYFWIPLRELKALMCLWQSSNQKKKAKECSWRLDTRWDWVKKLWRSEEHTSEL